VKKIFNSDNGQIYQGLSIADMKRRATTGGGKKITGDGQKLSASARGPLQKSLKGKLQLNQQKNRVNRKMG